ncbi:MAG TPA: hypothetical protein VIV82_12390, partial [Verrucomicrobiae bacterium]
NRPAVSSSAQDTRTLSVFMMKVSDFGGRKKLGRKPILTSVFGLQRGGRLNGLTELNRQMSYHATRVQPFHDFTCLTDLTASLPRFTIAKRRANPQIEAHHVHGSRKAPPGARSAKPDG